MVIVLRGNDWLQYHYVRGRNDKTSHFHDCCSSFRQLPCNFFFVFVTAVHWRHFPLLLRFESISRHMHGNFIVQKIHVSQFTNSLVIDQFGMTSGIENGVDTGQMTQDARALHCRK
jgi:hypothetical protein